MSSLQGSHEYRRLDTFATRQDTPEERDSRDDGYFQGSVRNRASLAMAPEPSANLDRLIQSSLFHASELPEPEEAERESPSQSHPDQAPLDRRVAP